MGGREYVKAAALLMVVAGCGSSAGSSTSAGGARMGHQYISGQGEPLLTEPRTRGAIVATIAPGTRTRSVHFPDPIGVYAVTDQTNCVVQASPPTLRFAASDGSALSMSPLSGAPDPSGAADEVPTGSPGYDIPATAGSATATLTSSCATSLLVISYVCAPSQVQTGELCADKH